MRERLAAAALVAVACAQRTSIEVSREPPSRPPTSCSGGFTIETFALDSIDLGENDWLTLGYDLDGKLTTKDSNDVCTQHPGAPRTNQADGNGGIDNAFGALVLPMLEVSLGDPTPSVTATNAIRQGVFTSQIQVTDLDDTPIQTCDGIKGQVFTSDAYGAHPAFDDTTDWPVLPESLNDGASLTAGAKAALADGYVQNGVVVLENWRDAPVPLHLVFDGKTLDLSVHHAIITFDHADAPDASSGVLAGVLDTDELIAALAPVLPPCCEDGCTADPIRDASDILSDATNAPGVPCDAISFAIGFHARRVANPTKVAAPLPPPPPSCP